MIEENRPTIGSIAVAPAHLTSSVHPSPKSTNPQSNLALGLENDPRATIGEVSICLRYSDRSAEAGFKHTVGSKGDS